MSSIQVGTNEELLRQFSIGPAAVDTFVTSKAGWYHVRFVRPIAPNQLWSVFDKSGTVRASGNQWFEPMDASVSTGPDTYDYLTLEVGTGKEVTSTIQPLAILNLLIWLDANWRFITTANAVSIEVNFSGEIKPEMWSGTRVV